MLTLMVSILIDRVVCLSLFCLVVFGLCVCGRCIWVEVERTMVVNGRRCGL